MKDDFWLIKYIVRPLVFFLGILVVCSQVAMVIGAGKAVLK